MCRTTFLALAALVGFAAPRAEAFPFYPSQIPNGGLNRCGNCHIDPAGGGPRNDFGLAFAANLYVWDATLAALDSDEDGHPNGEELQDPDGNWMLSDDPPGNPLLVSSPGWAFSTPGERALLLDELLVAPTEDQGGRQILTLANHATFEVDAAGLWILSGEDAYSIPNGQPQNTAIPASGSLEIVINGTDLPNIPGRIGEPASGGLDALASPEDFVAVYWIADQFLLYDLPHTMTDYVQWGAPGQPREDVAFFAAQWESGTFVAAPASGLSLQYDGEGNTAGDWVADALPTLSFVNLAFTQLSLLGLATPPSAWGFDVDVNADGVVDVADIVTQTLNASPEN